MVAPAAQEKRTRAPHSPSPLAGLPQPPGPRGAPGRRQVQTPPPLGGGAAHRRWGSAALNNGRLGRAPRLRARATAAAAAAAARRAGARGRRAPNAGARAPEGAGKPDDYACPPRGPRSLGARHQVIPQEASRIGPGAQGRICMSMAGKAP